MRRRLSQFPAAALGTLLGSVASTARRWRAKPLHPAGTCGTGALTIHRPSDTGAALIDEPETYCVTVRLSRAMGVPAMVPDIGGLAIRVHGPSTIDLLLAGTGSGRVSRFLLTLGWRPHCMTMTSYFPIKIGSHYTLFAAHPVEPGQTWMLSYARWNGPWIAFATLTVERWLDDDPGDFHFDPIGNRLPESMYPEVFRLLREPSYVT